MYLKIILTFFLLLQNAYARRSGDKIILQSSKQNFRECEWASYFEYKTVWVKRSTPMEDFRYYVRKVVRSKGAILIFHGMGDSACNFMMGFSESYRIVSYPERYLLNHFDLYFVEYPGFSRGGKEFKKRGFKKPTQKYLLQNTLQVYRHIRKQYPRGFKIFSLGHSLGTAMATHLAAVNNRHISGLILSAPFTSITEVVKTHFTKGVPVDFFFKGKFKAWDWASAVRAPTLIVVSKEDKITGFDLAKKQTKNFLAPVTFVEIEKGHHRNTPYHKEFFIALDKFLQDIVGKK